MDRTDVSLCLSLMSNSRAPYHELATELGLSINAVHKRVSAMTNLGIIRAFTAHPSLASVGATSVWVYGRSEAVRPGDAHLRLKKDERIYWVANSGGGYIYTGGYLRNIAELDEFVAFVKKEGEMSEPTVGIIAGSPPVTSLARGEKLRPLDYQILASLRKDSRKPVSEVASEVKASAKTVHRRLEWMIDKGLAEFTIDWYPDASNDIIGLCHVEIAPGYDRKKSLEVMMQVFQENTLLYVLFSNLPNLIVLFLWTNSMKQMENLRERVAGTSGTKSVMLNVLQIGYMFDTWRDKFSSGIPDPSP